MSRLSSFAQRLGHQRWFSALGRAMTPVDRLVARLTKGRFVALSMRELPSLLITTTGRKSGQPRSNPLLYVRDGDAYVVIGSNWGQEQHPAWSTNLLAHPRATVTVRGESIPVRARLADGAERERLVGLLRAMWPAYETYADRAQGRQLRVFRLERER
jgi:deazaflavin-dependent oxidoreductase (nitroreductase family)